MALSSEKIASLDKVFGGSAQTAPSSSPSLTPDKISRLDSIFGAAQQQKPDVSRGESFARGGYQGATGNFGDEIQAAGGAVVGYAADKIYGNDRSLADNYDDAIKSVRQKEENAQQSHPGYYTSGQVTGAIATGVGGAATKTGQAVTNSLRTGGRAARIGKGSVAGSTSGAVYGAGEGEGSERLESAGRGAVYGGVAGGAAPVIGQAVGSVVNDIKSGIKGVGAKTGNELVDVAEGMKSKAGKVYDQMRQVGATIRGAKTQQMISDIKAEVGKKKFIPKLNPKTMAVIEDLEEASKKGDIGLDELDQYRRLLSGINDEDGVSASIARSVIDDTVHKLTNTDLTTGSKQAVDLLKQGRAAYHQSSKFEKISNILSMADGDPNKIKAGLTRFVKNRKNLRGFNQNEIAVLNEAAKSNTTEKLLKMAGKFGIDLGSSLNVGNTVAPVIGGAVGGVPAVVGGTVARQAQKYIARGRAQEALDILAGGAKKTGGRPPVSGLLSAPAGVAAEAATRTESKPLKIDIPRDARKPYVPNESIPAAPAEALSPRTENSPQLLDKIAQAESGGNPNAKAKTSSASGLYQFTNSTWRGLVKKYGDEIQISYKDKNDPAAQRRAAEKFTADNAEYLSGKLDRAPTDGELYIAHFLGAPKAARFIALKDKNVTAATIFPNEAKANRNIFYKDGKPLSVAAVYELLSNKVA